jgi:Lipocalin-like domain
MPSNPLVGTWSLVAMRTTTPAGEVAGPFADGAAGSLIYTEEGHMAASIMPANRPNFASPDLRAGTPQEKIAAFETYLTYCGTYSVESDRVIHHVQLSLFPNWIGGDQVRFFEFSGGQLTLRTPPMVIDGVELTTQLLWRRIDATIQ